MTVPRSILFAMIVVATVATWLLFLSNRAPGTTAARDGLPLDDAWIHLVYARSLVEEGGLNYNAGVPETGMTSPLWAILAAAAEAVGRGVSRGSSAPAGGVSGPNPAAVVVLGVKILSLLAGIAAVFAVFALARTLGEPVWVAAGAALLAAFDPSLTFSRASGMEVSLFSALATAALVCAVTGRAVAVGVLAGLAVVTRPEGVVLYPLLAALLLLPVVRARAGSPPAASVRRLLLALGIALLPPLLYSLFCLAATGYPLPNTYYAKFSPRSPLSAQGLAFVWEHYVRDNLPYFTFEVGSFLAMIGVIRIVWRRGWRGALVLFAGILLFIVPPSTRHFTPGHYFYWERWLAPAFPFLLLAIVSGIGAAAEGARALVGRGASPASPRRTGKGQAARHGGNREPAAGPPRTSATLAAAGVAVALGAIVLAPLPRAFSERAVQFAWNCQNIEEINVRLGRWINEHLDSNAVIAVNDAGALRYFGRRETIDLLGLNDHEFLRRDTAAGLQPLVDRGVGYWVVFPSWFGHLLPNLPMVPIQETRAHHYTICDAPQDHMVVYRWDRP